MPTFDFACLDCGEVFEFSRPFGSTNHPSCPACGKSNTEKKISPPQIHFKGEGFYKTDSTLKPAPKEAPKAENPAPKPESKPKESTS